MSTANFNVETHGKKVDEPTVAKQRVYHRIHTVRQQQGTSLRSLARRLNMSVQEIRRQEDARTDLRISDLLNWLEILDVPLADLLVEKLL